MLQSNSKLQNLIDELWNSFWSAGISNPLTAIQQITYLLFMKRLDEIETKRERDAEFTGAKYKSRFSGKYTPYVAPPRFSEINQDDVIAQMDERRFHKEARARAAKGSPKSELRWSHFSKFPADMMLEHVRFNVFPFLKELNGETAPFTKHMANAVFVIEKPNLLVEAVKKIEEIFKEIERDAEEGGQSFQDIQGDVYEMLLGEIATAGKNGQFRTPRHIIKLMSELVAPHLGHQICDPACGTGGFLLGAYQFILTDLVRKKDPSKLVVDEDGFERGKMIAVLDEKLKKVIEESLYGYDIDSSMVRLGLMNLMMHGIDNPNLDYKDTLSKSYTENSQYDIVMANPPFTGSIDKEDINEDLKIPTTKTELLFVERIFNMLKMGGSAAIIVPQGVLFGAGKAFVQLRKKLVEEAELKAVITMPSGVFKPYAGVSTSILIFTKGGETEHTWFYDMKSDGYELNDKRTPLTKERGERDFGDLQEIVTKYKQRDVEKDTDRKVKWFMVPKSEIVEFDYDLSINIYKEEVYHEIEYQEPKEILEQLEKIEGDIQNELEKLREMIG